MSSRESNKRTRHPLESLLPLADRGDVETVLKQIGNPTELQRWFQQKKKPTVSVLEQSPLPTFTKEQATALVSDTESSPEAPEDILQKLYESLYLHLSAKQRLDTNYYIYRLPGPVKAPPELNSLGTSFRKEFCAAYEGSLQDCRVSCIREGEFLWTQLCLDDHQPPLVAVVLPDRPWVGVNQMNNSKAAPLRRIFLSAVECSLVEPSDYRIIETGAQGKDVYQLFQSLASMEQEPCRRLVGSSESDSNPLADLEQAATTSLLVEKPARKRKMFEDCPRVQHVRWDYRGRTESLGTVKCRVTLQGSNVYEGLQACIDAGYTARNLPSYVRNAPSLGASIRVVDGEVKQKM
jgi:hypothetical protein